jgi:hypothetical protein
MTFTSWLRKQIRRDDPVGDLARDVVVDPTWPHTRGYFGFHWYLQKIRACEGAQRSLSQAWAEWSQIGRNA